MSEGDGGWTTVFGGTVNCRGAVVADVGCGVAWSDDWACQGVSGDAGARLLVSLQALRSVHIARAMRRSLAEGMECILKRRFDCRPRPRTDFVEYFANVLVQQAIPCRKGPEVITGAG